MAVKSMKFLCGLVFCGLLAIPAVGSASSAKGAPWKFAADTPVEFEAQAAEVRKEMGTDGKYGAISVADRTAVEGDLDKIKALLESRGSAGKLEDREQVDLVNAQERINAVLTRNDGNRLVCVLETRSGTHFKEKVCQTAREREAIRRKSQQGFQDTLMKGGATQQRGN